MSLLSLPLRLFRLRVRDERLASRTQEVGTYHLCATTKPKRVAGTRFELFVKTHFLRTLVQTTAGLALAAWTAWNYAHVLRSFMH